MLGLGGPALALTARLSGTIPAVDVDRVARGSMSSLPLAPSAAVAAPSGSTILPGTPIPGISTSRPPDQARKSSAVEAFRSGTQALRAGDTSRGVTALEYAAANGHAVAQWKLGRMYAEGDGVGRDDLRAFEYFRGIADAHADDIPGTPQARFVANAFVALGVYYLDGIPNSRSRPIRIARGTCFTTRRPISATPMRSTISAGCTCTGRGATKDPKLAARWFGLAANKGHHQAQALLGSHAVQGRSGSAPGRARADVADARERRRGTRRKVDPRSARRRVQAGDRRRAPACADVPRAAAQRRRN